MQKHLRENRMKRTARLNKKAEEGLKSLLEFLVEEKRVDAVFAPAAIGEKEEYNYFLIKDKELIKNVSPFYPFMPGNAGKILAQLVLNDPFDKPCAVVAKPCEIRAFVEIVKQNQANPENVYFISYTCPGVFPLRTFTESGASEKVQDFLDNIGAEEISEDIRETCKACEHPVPVNSDITFVLFGEDARNESVLIAENEKGAGLLEGFGAEYIERKKNYDPILKKRKAEKERLVKEYQEKYQGLENLTGLFGRCISCHACSRVCPICSCNLCDFDSALHELKPEKYESEMAKRGGIRVPTNVLLFHLGRLVHAGVSCVNCGMCTDVCPSDIPVAQIFLKVGGAVQKLFDYTPGKDYEEELPMKKYEQEELVEFAL